MLYLSQPSVVGSPRVHGATGVLGATQIHKGETNTPQVVFEPCFAHKEQWPGPSMSLTRGCVAGSQLRWTQVDLVRHWLGLVKPKTLKTIVKIVIFVALVCRDVYDVLRPELTESFRGRQGVSKSVQMSFLLYRSAPSR